MSHTCKVCESDRPGKSFHALEMMNGTRESFEYEECSDCGSIQIAEAPRDLARFYEGEYYSMITLGPWLKQTHGTISMWLRARRAKWKITGSDMVGAAVARLAGEPSIQGVWDWFRSTGTSPRDRIIDVGCGSGELLFRLRNEGFSDLHGFDPFIPVDVIERGLRISREFPSALRGTFQLVMSHHSLEHIPDPRVGLEQLRSLVSDTGRILLRIPIAGGWAYRNYGAHWVQLDPPRHLVIPSLTGIQRILGECGLRIISVRYDSTFFQFVGSEHYVHGISIVDRDRSWLFESNRSEEIKKKIADYQRQADCLNGSSDGDQACFILEKMKQVNEDRDESGKSAGETPRHELT